MDFLMLIFSLIAFFGPIYLVYRWFTRRKKQRQETPPPLVREYTRDELPADVLEEMDRETDRIFDRRAVAERIGLYDLRMDQLHAIAKQVGAPVRSNKVDRIDSIMEKDDHAIRAAMDAIQNAKMDS